MELQRNVMLHTSYGMESTCMPAKEGYCTHTLHSLKKLVTYIADCTLQNILPNVKVEKGTTG